MNEVPEQMKIFAPKVGGFIIYKDLDDYCRKGIVTSVDKDMVMWDYDDPDRFGKFDATTWVYQLGSGHWTLNERLVYELVKVTRS